MLQATLLALAAAGLHAAWNLAVKQSADRFLALWSQYLVAGPLCAVVVAVVGLPARGWVWAGVSGLVHLPYVVFLARAYDLGEFSVVYPVARGGGAALAALGGIVVLGDELSVGAVAAIAVITGGLVALATTGPGTPSRSSLVHAVVVAVTIAVYSLADAHGIRTTGTAAYALATFVTAALTISAYGLATRRAPAVARHLVTAPRQAVVTGLAAVVTYSLVQLAFRRAPVGYVTALRESSVVIATVVGWKLLGEGGGARRAVCALVVVAGLVLLVVAR